MNELSNRDQRARQRVSREGQRRYRSRQKLLLETTTTAPEDITPTSCSRFVLLRFAKQIPFWQQVCIWVWISALSRHLS